MKKSDIKPIFFFTARVPLVQVLTIFILGGIALTLAINIKVGQYIGFEPQIVKEEETYVISIPDEYRSQIDDDALGKWCLNKSIGKRSNLLYDGNCYILEVEGLNPQELASLDDADTVVFVEFRVGEQALLYYMLGDL